MIVAPLLILTAFAESPFKPEPPSVQQQQPQQLKGPPGKSLCAAARQPAATNAQGIANLPWAMGRRFATLNAYLTHLECLAQPVDLPWWKEIRPGVYRHMTTATIAPPNEVATRAELMERFGFSR